MQYRNASTLITTTTLQYTKSLGKRSVNWRKKARNENLTAKMVSQAKDPRRSWALRYFEITLAKSTPAGATVDPSCNWPLKILAAKYIVDV